MLQKGTISSIEQDKTDKDDNPTTARVLPCTADSLVTLPLTIQWWLRGEMGSLEVGDEVVYCMFEDGSGTIIARMDGNWNGRIHGDLEILKGSVEMTDGDLTIEKGNVNIAEGDILMVGDLTQTGNQTVAGETSVTGNVSSGGNISATGNVDAEGDMSATNVSATGEMEITGNVTASGDLNLTGSLSAAAVTSSGDVASSSATLNTVNSNLETLKATYESHTHTTTEGQTSPPV